MTQEELEALSDDEINIQIVRSKGQVIKRERISGELMVYRRGFSRIPDYCNDPAAIMPIAIENNISLEWWIGPQEWMACSLRQLDYLDPEYTASNKNPYRSIAIVYLLMRGDKDE